MAKTISSHTSNRVPEPKQRKKPENNSNLNELPVIQALWQVFYPLALAMTLSSTVGLVDMFIASKLGTNAQAAVGLGDQMIFLVIVLGTGISTACSSFVSRFAGAGDLRSVIEYSKMGLLVSFCVGLFASLLGIFFAPPMLIWMGANDDVLKLAAPYASVSSFANLFFVVSLCLSAIFRAVNESKKAATVLISTAISANLLCCLFFFFTPMHNLNALAYSWNIGSLIGCIFGLIEYRKLFTSLRFGADNLVDKEIGAQNKQEAIKEMISIGIPAMLSELCLVASQLVMYKLLASMNDAASLQAAWTVKLKIEELVALIPLLAFSASTAVVVGQSIGAKLKRRVVKTVGSASAVAFVSMLLVGSIMSFQASPIFLFLCTKETATAAANLMTPSVVLLPLTALSAILVAALEGSGVTKLPMLVNLAFQVFGKYHMASFFNNLFPESLIGFGIGLCLTQLGMFTVLMIYSRKLLTTRFDIILQTKAKIVADSQWLRIFPKNSANSICSENKLLRR